MPARIGGVAFSRNSKYLAIGLSKGGLLVFDTDELTEVYADPEAKSGYSSGLGFMANDRYLLYPAEKGLKVLDLQTKTTVRTIPGRGAPFPPTDRSIVTIEDNVLKVYRFDAEAPETSTLLAPRTNLFAISPDGCLAEANLPSCW